MGPCPSGDVYTAKRRKPYTIRKQREKWTDEEHNRFIEALKLHGRAWQRIQEHIGTKTAVQIRSHAQKFFSKLEKEALVNGHALGQANDIEIPPPRPKRKPNCPYPQNVGISPETSSKEPNSAASTGSAIAVTTSGQYSSLKCDPPQQKTVEQTSEEGSESLAHKTALSAFSCFNSSLQQIQNFVPMVKEVGDKIVHSESCQTDEKNNERQKIQVGNSNTKDKVHDETSKYLQVNEGQKGTDRANKSENSAPSLDNYRQTCLCNIEHEQAQPTDRKSMKIPQVPCSVEYFSMPLTKQVNPKESTNLFMNPKSSVMQGCQANATFSSNSRMFPAYSHYSPFFSTEDAYGSFMSSASSSLIFSGLLQNPAIHTVTSFAASLWPSINIKNGVNLTPDSADGARKELDSFQGMATIAAATVAAASAWWATYGLLPLFPHLHPSYTLRPPLAVPAQTMTNIPTSEGDTGNKDERLQNLQRNKNQQVVCREHSEALRKCASEQGTRGETSEFSKLKTLSYTESNTAQVTGLSYTESNTAPVTGLTGQSKAKTKKNGNCLSYGSNTFSHDDLEKLVSPENQEKVHGVMEQESSNHHTIRYINKCRGDRNNCANNYGVRKLSNDIIPQQDLPTVQAFFSTGTSTQNFSLPFGSGKSAFSKGKEAPLPINLKGKACISCRGNSQGKDLSISVLDDTKLDTGWNGFKPCNKCSIEAKEKQATTEEEGTSNEMQTEG